MVVLGVDPSTTRLALADEDGRTGAVSIPQQEKGSVRLADIHLRTRLAVRTFIRGKRPRVCFVESPAGHVHPSLWMAVGVIQAAIFLELATLDLQQPVNVLTLGPTEWKKLLLGNAQATKAEIMEWAQAHGFVGETQDEADAYGIARAGLMLLKPSLAA